jgi:hypothetical protein
MKLLTEMQDGCVHANGYCVDEDAVELRQAEKLVHDAAAAHALMQAMEEIEGTYADCAPASDIRQFLRERADELMREWGFGEAAES